METQFIRAEYDDKRQSFISEIADWIDGEPSLEYRFSLEETDYSWQGGLEKRWIEADREHYSEFYAFGEYRDKQAFEADVSEILAQARAKAETENIDDLLAVIDIVKERAVDQDYDDEAVEEFEGLFQNGPEDAYSFCDIGADYRLHHHIERDDECWFLRTLPVVDQDNKPLGWGLFAVHLPELNSTATRDEIREAKHARILLLDHCRDKADALYAKHGFEYLMEDGERVVNPEYSRMNDTEAMGFFARNAEWSDELEAFVWQEYSDESLVAFLNGTKPYVCDRSQWMPREKRIVDHFFDDHPQPTWLEDQLRATLDDQMGIESDIDEDSPWNDLDLDDKEQ